MTKRFLKTFFFPFLLLISFQPIGAEEQSLGEVVVRKPTLRRGEPAEDAILSATVIEGDTLKGRKITLNEAVSESTGVHLRRYGGLEDFATLSIRGSTSEQSLIYLDGMLLNPAEGGGTNLATIPIDQIERIEIYRGAAPARLGTSSLGGVVSLKTKRGLEPRLTKLRGSYGSWNSWESGIFQSQNFRNSSYLVDYQLTRTDGDFSFLNDQGTPFNPSDDQREARSNNELARHNLLFKFSKELPVGELQVQETFLREDRGIPGLGSLTSTAADLSTTKTMTQFDWSEENWRLAPYFQYQKQQFSDPLGEIGLGIQENDNDTYTYGGDSSLEYLLGTAHHLTVVVGYRGEQFLEDSGQPTSKNLRNQGNIGLEDEMTFWEERLLLNPSFRLENIFNEGTRESTQHLPSGKIGARYQVTPPLSLKTNFARANRIPNFSELFGDRGSLIGNPDLVSESGWNWDIGSVVGQETYRWETTYFLNHAKNLIQFVQTSQNTARAENLTAARIQGVETSLWVPLFDFADVTANYTFQHPVNTSGLPGTSGKILPGRPQHEVSGQSSLFNHWGKLFTQLTYMDGNYLDSQNLLRISHRLLWSSGLSWSPTEWVTTSLEAKNLLNDQIQDVIGFPLPGRSYYAKVEFSI